MSHDAKSYKTGLKSRKFRAFVLNNKCHILSLCLVALCLQGALALYVQAFFWKLL